MIPGSFQRVTAEPSIAPIPVADLTADGLGWLASLARAEHKCRMARAQGGRGTDSAGLFFRVTSIKRLILCRKFSEFLFLAEQPSLR